MSQHPIEGMMSTTMQKIKEMVDVNTIIGAPMTTPDGTTIIPVSKVSYGFAAGGTDIPSKLTTENKDFFGGGSGAGISIKPVAFLTVHNGEVKLLNLEEKSTGVEKIIESSPELVQKFAAIFKKDKKGTDKDTIGLDDPEI